MKFLKNILYKCILYKNICVQKLERLNQLTWKTQINLFISESNTFTL